LKIAALSNSLSAKILFKGKIDACWPKTPVHGDPEIIARKGRLCARGRGARTWWKREATMSDPTEAAVMKTLIENLLAKAKNAKRDFKMTTTAGGIQTIAGNALMDQEIMIGDFAISWTDGSRTYVVPYSKIDHLLMV
jgi:hypothetical protein